VTMNDRDGYLMDAVQRHLLEHLVDIDMIAQRTGCGKTAVSNWITRYPDFPLPVQTFGRSKVWFFPEVERFLEDRSLLRKGTVVNRRIRRETANGSIIQLAENP
jgi:predicted DNA-binding transcriptional regulator AlpA